MTQDTFCIYINPPKVNGVHHHIFISSESQNKSSVPVLLVSLESGRMFNLKRKR